MLCFREQLLNQEIFIQFQLNVMNIVALSIGMCSPIYL
jgi:hypothetical protein